MIDFEFFFDPDIGMTHARRHNVSAEELQEFFTEIDYLTSERKDKSCVSIGKLANGRYILVVYRVKTPNLYYVITAYDIKDRDLITLIDNLVLGDRNT